MEQHSMSSHSAVVRWIEWVDARDQRVMRRVNRWTPPRFVRLWMVAATRGGDGWLWYAAAAVIAIFGGDARWSALSAAFLSVAIGIAVFLVMKRACNRRRPCHIAPHSWAELLPPDQFSFPSGHTITAFAVALSLGSFYPDLDPGLLFCAVSIAASRIMLGMHYVSDVVAGAAIGGGDGRRQIEIERRIESGE